MEHGMGVLFTHRDALPVPLPDTDEALSRLVIAIASC